MAPAPAPLVILDRIEFDSGSPLVRDQDRPVLDRIVEALKQRPNVRLVEIHRHTDDGGERDPNLVLSQQRADTVRAYLVTRGIDGVRLRSRAFGKTVPLFPNDTAEGRAKNRRVDFRILEQ
jgi:OOP family OmpA-OmpF porin